MRRAALVLVVVLLAGACSDDTAAETTTTVAATTTTVAAVGGDFNPVAAVSGGVYPIVVLSGPIPDPCAAEMARDLATFEAALAAEPTRVELCAVVGRGDEIASRSGRRTIVRYDLDDGGQVRIAYGNREGPPLKAHWVGPNGDSRSLLGGPAVPGQG
jgi:hypothetical protein